MEERAELVATQWVLSNNPELTSFSLKTLSFDGKKVKEIVKAGASIIVTGNVLEENKGICKIRELVTSMNPQ